VTPLTEPRFFYWIGVLILLIAVVLTLWSMVIYLRAFLTVLRQQENA